MAEVTGPPRVKRCSICVRGDVDALNLALAAGGSVRAVGERFGVDPSAVQRHKRHALTALVPRTSARLPGNETEAGSVHSTAWGWHSRVLQIYKTAHARGNHELALKAAEKATKLLQLLHAIEQDGRGGVGHGGGGTGQVTVNYVNVHPPDRLREGALSQAIPGVKDGETEGRTIDVAGDSVEPAGTA